MQNLYYNVMTIVCVLKKSHFFIIFIINSKWLEIHKKLKFKQQINDQLNLIVRLFQIKLKMLLNKLKKKNLLNSYIELIYIIEYQKRDFFYIHILLIFTANALNYKNSNIIDQTICAKLSSYKKNLNDLFIKQIKFHMIHDFCEQNESNVSCIQKIIFNDLKKCNKSFFKQFNN